MSGMRRRLVRWTGYLIFYFITIALPLNFILLWFVKQNLLTELSYYVAKTPVFSYRIPDLRRGDAEQVLFVGDSNAQGAGDAYLTRVYDYSLAHMYAGAHKVTVHNAGKGGYGSMRAARNAIWLDRLSASSAVLPDMPHFDRAVFVFYEGNDLDNNMRELAEFGNPDSPEAIIAKLTPSVSERVVDGYLAGLQGLLLTLNEQELRPLYNRLIGYDPRAFVGGIDLVLADGTRHVPPMQAASPELTDAELARSLKLFRDSVDAVRTHFHPEHLEIVYVPSPLTVYASLQGTVDVQSYQGRFNRLDVQANAARSRVIRDYIEGYAHSVGARMVDPTEAMQRAARAHFLHGPKDPHHPNLDGYRVIFDYWQSLDAPRADAAS